MEYEDTGIKVTIDENRLKNVTNLSLSQDDLQMNTTLLVSSHSVILLDYVLVF